MTPIEQLNIILRKYPNTNTFVDQYRAGRGVDLPNWPDWCFLPMAAWYAIVSEQHKVDNLNINQVADVSVLTALGTWQYSKGIYEINSDLVDSLFESTVFGNLPADVFKRLPEWCIYIKTPNLELESHKIGGFFAHLEWDANTKREELRLLINFKDGRMLPLPVHIGDWTVEQSVKLMLEEANHNAERDRSDVTRLLDNASKEEGVQFLTEVASGLISILLYVCSEEPEIDHTRQPGKSLYRPQAIQTRKGLRLFPARHTHLFKLGESVGEKLRVQRLASAGISTNRRVRTHLRRGHWHGYWTGPRSEKQTFVYRWIPPLVVGGK